MNVAGGGTANLGGKLINVGRTTYSMGALASVVTSLTGSCSAVSVVVVVVEVITSSTTIFGGSCTSISILMYPIPLL